MNSAMSLDVFLAGIVHGDPVNKAFYRRKQNRIIIIRYLVEVCLKRQGIKRFSIISTKELKEFNLYNFVHKYYQGNTRRALLEAYAEELSLNPYVQDSNLLISNFFRYRMSPGRKFWQITSNRQKTVRYLVEKVLTKNPYEVEQKEFIKNNLASFLNYYYQGSSFKALREAYPELPIYLFPRVDADVWQDKNLRQQAFDHVAPLLPSYKKWTKNLLITKGLKPSLLKYYQNDIKLLLNDLAPYRIV